MIRKKQVQEYVESIVGDCLHAKRVLSLSNAVLGVMHSSSLALSTIGQALAIAEGLQVKHAIKQVDRLFSNQKIILDTFFFHWVACAIKAFPELTVALDWTDFDKDGQCTLALNLITRNGRATPLLWKSYKKSEMKGHRSDYEDDMLVRLKACLPEGKPVVVLADRGFADRQLFGFIRELGFDFVIRFKGNIRMTNQGVCRATKQWLLPSGKAHKYAGVTLTQEGYYVPAVVCVHDKKMKDAWFLATSLVKETAQQITKLYGKRFRIEETFRDVKDIRFGMGLSYVHIEDPERRDRLLLVSAIASTLLTLLGAAGEAIGLDRLLKANTSKKRTHSWLTQGAFYFQAMLKYKEDQLLSLMNKFHELLLQESVFYNLFALTPESEVE